MDLTKCVFLLSPVFLLLLSPSSIYASKALDSDVPIPGDLTGLLEAAVYETEKASSLVADLVGRLEGSFFTHAVMDCLELLDLSAQELTWALQGLPTATSGVTPSRKADMVAWVGAVLTNLDTCIEGLDGVGWYFQDLAEMGLGRLMSLAQRTLRSVHDLQVTAESDVDDGKSPYPEWALPGGQHIVEIPLVDLPVNAVVALDGTGDFSTVTEAVESAPDNSSERYVIYVKAGVYKEYVKVEKKKTNLMMVGDGMNATVITGDHSNADGYSTYASATFAVTGWGFIARDMTFENTAGPEKHQAVAFRSDSDRSLCHRCGIHGYQDTLYAHSLRQFYHSCNITGTVDFIFGNAAAVFQHSLILARKPLPKQRNTVTAHGRTGLEQHTGFSIHRSVISGDWDLLRSGGSTETYLGRPWRPYSTTMVMKSYVGEVVSPKGWLEWDGEGKGLDTLYYAEYMNYGPRADLAGRVNWTGYHPLLPGDVAEAANFTVAELIDGNKWLPFYGIRYICGI